MYQVIKCECGEKEIQDGRCCGCGRVRPSSSEIIKRIEKLQDNTVEELKRLERALKLEKRNK